MAVETRQPSRVSRLVRALLLWLYRRHGWTAKGEIPEPRRFVLIAGGHTSNWDFVYFLGLTEAVGIMPYFMGKKSLFKWPMRNFMLDMGGVPVDRASSQNYVDQMAAEFAQRDEFILTVAPEGTRGKIKQWKTGFYHIAMAAKVPLVMGYMDYGTKTGGLGPTLWPTGNYSADMEKVASFYSRIKPKFPRPEGFRIIAEEQSDV